MSDSITRQQFLEEIAQELHREGATDAGFKTVLEKVLAQFDCVVGTIHTINPESGLLHLHAQRGIPVTIMERVARIPIGKGMAGLAAERREPVQVCNLQVDDSGVAKPGARDTRMEGSIAVPMLVGDELRGVLGVAKPIAYEFSQEETEFLLKIATLIGKSLP